MKSAVAKVDILVVSKVVKVVWKFTPSIISWDVKAFSLRSFRKAIMSSSIWLRLFPFWNSFLSMGIETRPIWY